MNIWTTLIGLLVFCFKGHEVGTEMCCGREEVGSGVGYVGYDQGTKYTCIKSQKMNKNEKCKMVKINYT